MSGSTSANDAADPQMAAIRRRRALAQLLTQQSQSPEVIRSPWQGLARVLQAAGGGVTDYMAGREQDELNTERRAGANQFMAALLQGGAAPDAAQGAMPQQAPAPVAGAPSGPTDAEALAQSRARLASMSGRPPEGVPTGRMPENAGAMIPNPDRPGEMIENPWHGARGQISPQTGQLFSAAPTSNAALGQALIGTPQAPAAPTQHGPGVPSPDRLMSAYGAAANSDNPLIRQQAPLLLQMAQFGSLREDRIADNTRADRSELRQAESAAADRAFRERSLALQAQGLSQQQAHQQALLELQRLTAGVPSGYLPGPNGSLIPRPGGPADPTRNGGPYQGTSIEAQDSNILLRGDPASQEYAAAFARQAAPRVNTDGSSVTPNMQAYRTPSYNPNASPTGAPAAPAPPTASSAPAAPDYGRPTITEPTRPNTTQSRVGAYVQRMQAADRIISNPTVSAAGNSLTNRALNQLPVVGNYLSGDDFQSASQAQRDFINAILRQESGAAIGASEFASAQQQYFPQPGDSPRTIQQKAENRRVAIEGMTREAGPAAPAAAPSPPQGAGWSIRPVQ